MAAPLPVESFPLPAPALEVVEAYPTEKIHGTVRVHELGEDVRWTLEVPEDGLSYQGLMLLLPGLGCVKRHSRGERHASAVAGEATISYEPARLSGSALENLFLAQRLPSRTADTVLNDVQARFKSLEERRRIPGAAQIDPHQVTLSPHSMGGHSATALGLARAGEVDAVIYKASVGFGTPNWRAIHQLDLAGTLVEILDYVLSERQDMTSKQGWQSIRYFFRSPSRSLGELASCLTTDMSEDVLALRDKGIPTAYIGFGKDGLVPVEPVEPIAREAVDIFEVLPSMGHLAPQRYPAETVAAVRGLRRRLQAA